MTESGKRWKSEEEVLKADNSIFQRHQQKCKNAESQSRENQDRRITRRGMVIGETQKQHFRQTKQVNLSREPHRSKKTQAWHTKTTVTQLQGNDLVK